ncbi:MAG: hypothetical protein HYY66_01565 [Candidatus Tectomicrobia bacterium]|nr:hypothetical protein [Candidatus Tectomicrobia bacterium]
MPPVVVLQQIKAPAEKVFAFVGNVLTHPQIAPFCKEVRITSPGGHKGAGTRLHQIFHDRPAAAPRRTSSSSATSSG